MSIKKAIRLVKKYPHIKDEDVISIFQEGYVKGFENGRKGTIPIEFIEEQIEITTDINSDELDVLYAGNLSYLLKLWEKKNGK